MVDDDSSVRAPDGASGVSNLERLTADVRKLKEAVEDAPFTEIMREYDTLQGNNERIQTEYAEYRERKEVELLRLHDYESLGTLDYCRGLVAATTELENKVRELGISNDALRSDQSTAVERVTQIEISTHAELALLEQYKTVKGKDSSPQNYAEVVRNLDDLRRRYTERGVEVEEAVARGETLQQTNTQLKAKQQLADDTVLILRGQLETATVKVNEWTQWYKTRGAPSS